MKGIYSIAPWKVSTNELLVEACAVVLRRSIIEFFELQVEWLVRVATLIRRDLSSRTRVDEAGILKPKQK